jgi:hypothetical protein
MWYWRRMEISWTDRVKSEEVSYTVKDDRTNLTEGRKEVAGRRGRRRKQLLYDLEETRDTGNCKRKH